MATLAVINNDTDAKPQAGFLGRMFAYAYVTINPSRVRIVTADALSESFEDAQLNAIADERKDGPFVRVRVSDL